jgi:chaperonin GroEL
MLQDLAILTGGKAIMKDLGVELDSLTVADLGRCKKVHVDNDHTTILEGTGTSAEIQGRIDQIRREIEVTTSEYDVEKLQERLAKLSNGVAQINVGAATETEMKERKARIEDALHATRAAIEEGVVPGGGVALVRCLKALDGIKAKGDEKTGVNIIRQSLTAPIKQIATNAGLDGSVVLHKVAAQSGAFGFNAATGEYTDMVKDGVIDPTKVVRIALENGSSVARILLSTDCIITDKPQPADAGGDDHGDPHHGGGDMGGMGGGMGGMGGGMGF